MCYLICDVIICCVLSCDTGNTNVHCVCLTENAPLHFFCEK